MVGKSGTAILYHPYIMPQTPYEDGDNFPMFSAFRAFFLCNFILISAIFVEYLAAIVHHGGYVSVFGKTGNLIDY